ncbi:trehalose-phosphatase [candidate division GN15 bacterium]|uniref:Trehalose 6-phosphate phosphatase n=1 Tax=candidate division GN15 bacterium TaxID=2072418 RepID=A0A855WX40_9BACT|nr:MAG: trehalose-phosphatase [candidate division GN15 bacterium]
MWAFDFDGTLSHLVPDRHAAALDPECEDMLRDLSADTSQVVAVTSSRTLEDLKSRVSVDNVILSGSSGLEWWVPGGHWIGPNGRARERLSKERKRIVPGLMKVEQIPGVEVEDKTWSAAVHFRHVAQEDRLLVSRELENLRTNHGIALHYGPDVAEIQFIPESNKKLAVQTLVKLFGSAYSSRDIVYAGDDQNDALAMRWVLERKGIVYVVGDRISVNGANVVESPTALARAVRKRFARTQAMGGDWSASHE